VVAATRRLWFHCKEMVLVGDCMHCSENKIKMFLHFSFFVHKSSSMIGLNVMLKLKAKSTS
jgi:hypothetical protein